MPGAETPPQTGSMIFSHILRPAAGLVSFGLAIIAGQPGAWAEEAPTGSSPEVSRPAPAGPAAAEIAPGSLAPLAQPRAPQLEHRSPGTARELAILTTLGGYALVGVGVAVVTLDSAADSAKSRRNDRIGASIIAGGMITAIVGPSAGHFYAGEAKHGLVFSALRTGALVAGSMAVGLALCDSEGKTTCTDSATTDLLFLGGLGLAAGLGLYDWWDSANAARRFNAKEAARAGRGASALAPMLDPTHGTIGLAVVGTM